MPARILVVDDEPDLELLIRQKYRRKIKEQELDFKFAQHGLEALEILSNENAIDIVLTDLNMPQMDGLTLLGQMRDRFADIRAVVVSAYGDMENIRTAMNRGAFDFLTKPLNFSDLDITVEKTLQEIEKQRRAKRAQTQLSLMQHELGVARKIQTSMLPRNFDLLDTRPRFQLHAQMTPAQEVGGDFYDFFMIDDDHLGFAIGDVSGKGVPAAIFMALSRSFLRMLGMRGHAPEACVSELNDMLCDDNDGRMFVTLFYGVLGLGDGEVIYCNGGHNLPYIVRKNGEVVPLPRQGGMALGVRPGNIYHPGSFALRAGDHIFLYTDGVTEAMNAQHEEFMEHRLEGHLAGLGNASPVEMIEGVANEVKKFVAGEPQSDDVTMLCIKHR